MDIDQAKEICNRFASTFKLIFKEEGEVGFGRECVGFVTEHGSYLDYHPYSSTYKPGEINVSGFEEIKEFAKVNLHAPDGIESYHKHDCLAVLGSGDEAIIQLAKWVLHMEAQAEKANGQLFVAEYDTGRRGMQAMFSGATGRAIGVR